MIVYWLLIFFCRAVRDYSLLLVLSLSCPYSLFRFTLSLFFSLLLVTCLFLRFSSSTYCVDCPLYLHAQPTQKLQKANKKPCPSPPFSPQIFFGSLKNLDFNPPVLRNLSTSFNPSPCLLENELRHLSNGGESSRARQSFLSLSLFQSESRVRIRITKDQLPMQQQNLQ